MNRRTRFVAFHASRMLCVVGVLCAVAASALVGGPSAYAEETVPKSSLFEFSAESLDGERVDLGRFQGKVVLVVNTASRCGFTSQYEDLEKLYRDYADKGVVVLGFPSNDFASQEPGTNAQIREFCKTNYGVTFPMFSKGPVTGPEKQPVYRFLTEQSDEEFQGEVGWNFVKFLVDQQGRVVERFSSMKSPSGSSIRQSIDALLRTHPVS